MTLLNKLIVLLLLLGFYAPANAAVTDLDTGFCSVFSETEKSDEGKDGKKGGEEEEPDCE